ncbi:MAG: hypothetical protein WB662_09800 [Methyloceanibacter sp.]
MDQALKERLQAALARLPISEANRAHADTYVDFAAGFIWFRTHIAREEMAHRENLWWELASIKERDRKPVAAVTTDVAAAVFKTLTGLPVTRVSKVKKGRRGQQETGQFAQFLDEILRILEIDAKPAGQIKLYKQIEANKLKPPA